MRGQRRPIRPPRRRSGPCWSGPAAGTRRRCPRLRRAPGRTPKWRSYGDLAAHAQRSWVELIGGPDLTLKESLERKVAAMKADLTGPEPTP